MMVRTTININVRVLEKLSSATRFFEFDTDSVISALMNYTGKRIKQYPQKNIQIKYQDRCEKTEWRTIHIAPRPDEYEYYQDLRKVMKMSVSFIIAFAIEIYLDELLNKMNINLDNYRYRNYAIAKIIHKSVICWVHYWGIPPELLDFSP